ncbi:MAG: hypothetical protein ABW202_00315 [Duganella sp.]
MKKYLCTGLLAIALCSPALAQNKFVAATPDEPLHYRSILLCVAVLIGLQAYARRSILPRKHRV